MLKAHRSKRDHHAALTQESICLGVVARVAARHKVTIESHPSPRPGNDMIKRETDAGGTAVHALIPIALEDLRSTARGSCHESSSADRTG
jgi:hypothetical protein